MKHGWSNPTATSTSWIEDDVKPDFTGKSRYMQHTSSSKPRNKTVLLDSAQPFSVQML